MRLYRVVSLLLCSWKAEVYINTIYAGGALKDITTAWKDVTPTSAKLTLFFPVAESQRLEKMKPRTCFMES